MFDIARGRMVQYKEEIFFGAIVFLVATASFGLGYLANREYTHAPIVIEQRATTPLSGK